MKQPFNLEVKNSRWNTRDSCGNSTSWRSTKASALCLP